MPREQAVAQKRNECADRAAKGECKEADQPASHGRISDAPDEEDEGGATARSAADGAEGDCGIQHDRTMPKAREMRVQRRGLLLIKIIAEQVGCVCDVIGNPSEAGVEDAQQDADAGQKEHWRQRSLDKVSEVVGRIGDHRIGRTTAELVQAITSLRGRRLGAAERVRLLAYPVRGRLGLRAQRLQHRGGDIAGLYLGRAGPMGCSCWFSFHCWFRKLFPGFPEGDGL